MKGKIFLIISTLFFVEKAFALSCNELEKIADDNKAIYNPYLYNDDTGAPTNYDPYQSTVKGNKGYRTYFHSAPSAQCKIKNLFIIANDTVTVDYSFRYENQEWLSVTYWNKHADSTSGWIVAKDLTEPKRVSASQ